MSISKYHVSKNLFDTFDIVGQVPSVSNGALVNSVSGGTTSLINMNNAEIVLSYNVVGNIYLFLYDTNSQFIGYSQKNNGDNIYSTSISGYVNACYCRVRVDSLSTFNDANIMLNTGSTSLPYQPYGNTFKNWFYRKRETATDTITTFPKQIIADGQSATANIIGNMNQQGTPSPSSIIMPSECGNKTANLFYKRLQGLNITSIGKIQSDSQYDLFIARVTAGETYTVSKVGGCYGFFENEPAINAITIDNSRVLSDNVSTFTVPVGANYVAVRYIANSTSKMCNTGSELLPYQPYGFQIPISSGGTTTNVYLGEVQSTRNIKQLVLTGEEQVNMHPTIASWFQIYLTDIVIDNLELCTHYKPSLFTAATIQNGEILVGKQTSFNDGRIIIRDTSYSTAADFKTYLQQQYANDTPVTVWYVLATPTTGTLNEPIRKIGSYADSVSVTNIPTTTGTAESFDVDTDLKPSEVDLTYHGWHEHSDTKF